MHVLLVGEACHLSL